MNTVEAKTRIEDNLDQRDACIKSTANVLAKFIIDNAGSRQENQMDVELKKLTSGYSIEELVEIYRRALAIVSVNMSGGKSKKNNNNFGGASDFLKGKRGSF